MKCTVDCLECSVRHVEMISVQVLQEFVQPLIHFGLQLHEAGVVEWDAYMAGESRSSVTAQWAKT